MKQTLLIIIGWFLAIGLGFYAAFDAWRRRRAQTKANDIAESLAEENARRARAQADEAQRIADATAAEEAKSAHDNAVKEASHAATVGDLAGYLRHRPKG